MRHLLTAAAAAVLLAGCTSTVLKASDVKEWPLKSATAEITCDGGQLGRGFGFAL
jgi:hypothetical protein